jgi:RNA polymerase sigma-70 factor (ECF subfamily)
MDRSEEELLLSLTQNLPGGYQQIIQRYQSSLYTLALRLTGSQHDAEDLVQEALINAYVSLENYPIWRIRSLKLKSWLYRVTLNVYNHYTRGARLHLVSLQQEDQEQPLFEERESERPEMLFENQELRQEMETLVAQLPVRYRVALVCYYFEEMNYQEMAELFDQPIGTIKSTISRGIRLLRTMIANTEGGEEKRQWNQSKSRKV